MTNAFPMSRRKLKQAANSSTRCHFSLEHPPALCPYALPSVLLLWNLDDFPFYPRKHFCPLSPAPSSPSDNTYQHAVIYSILNCLSRAYFYTSIILLFSFHLWKISVSYLFPLCPHSFIAVSPEATLVRFLPTQL